MKEQQGPIKEQHGFTSNNQSKLHFGNYDLVRRIDVGGMGEVYLAHQRTAFGREVAVKIIRSDLVHDMTARKRFLREAEVSAHLKHEHILPLVEFGEEQGRLFLVTPYIKGGTLLRRLQSGPLSLSEVHQLFSALVQAVAYIHKRGVIHRDLKPSNILLDQEEGNGQIYVRLIDFGIASIQGTTASPPLTTAGNEMGTAAYMAPERLSGVAAASNDIFSLGVMLYQMLTGRLPSDDNAPSLPPALASIVRRCIAPNPQDRFANADELLKAFEYAYRSMSASSAVSSPLPPMQPDLDGDDFDNSPTPRRVTISQPLGNAPRESKALASVGAVEPLQPQLRQSSTFSGEDYNAPTSYVGPTKLQVKRITPALPVVGAPPRDRKRRNGSLLGILSFSIILVLLAIASLIFFEFKSVVVVSANVTVSPQTHVVSNVFTITAKPTLRSVDVATSSVPANVLTSIKTGSQEGATTGQADCVLGIFDCKQAVSFSDVDRLVLQIRPAVQAQVEQDLQRQAHALGVTTVGSIHYADGEIRADPPVGSVSKTVTVTLTEQGSVEYVKTSDVQGLARVLLQQQVQQLGANYVLLNQLTQIGQPAFESVDANGNVTIQIAAGGVAEYQIPSAELKSIQSHIKGMKVKDARAFLAKQAGIDPNTVVVHVTYGDTMPGDVQQIKIVSINPTNLPLVHLPAVKAGTPTT